MYNHSGSHCIFYHRYHIVSSTRYCYKVLTGVLRLRVRDICRQVCGENGVEILRDVISKDHVHMFVLDPPKLAMSDLVRKMKGRSSFKIQREFVHIRKRYWGCRLWGREFFSTTCGAIT
ncbi:MAG: IS200/IS605 family transposase [Aestuariivita sp.]|nr:IS200/IS605 family transposase [Aestuariivita sp.]